MDDNPRILPVKIRIYIREHVGASFRRETNGKGALFDCRDILQAVVGLTPVSYTHLDVYKRQEETFKFTSSVVGGAIPKEYIPAVGEGIEEACKTGILGGFPVPVSYTHLRT